MSRPWLVGLFVIGLLSTAASAQDGPQRGKIKKVDAATNTIVITADGKDHEVMVPSDAKLAGTIAGPGDLGKLPVGADVMFRATERGGKLVLVGLMVREPNAGGQASGQIRRGQMRKLDLSGMTITVNVGGEQRSFALSPEAQVLGGRGNDLRERLEAFKEGSAIFFRAESRNGKEIIVALKLDDGNAGPGGQPQQPKFDTSKLKPLSEMGPDEYQGFRGGFYPEGANERPAAHEAAGLALARQVQPLDASGKANPSGKIVLLSIGMSNTSQASQGFQKAFHADTIHNSAVVFVNGAQGGMTASRIQDPVGKNGGEKYWDEIDNRLKSAGLTREQVQVAWVKQADAGPSEGFPRYAKKLQGELARIVQVSHDRFPNLKLVYLTSRTYGGYAKTALNPEPYAFESGFSVKWLIEDQIKGNAELNYDPAKGAVKAPWLSWGPYFWANGSTARHDGFRYSEADFAGDGTHLSTSGIEKVGRLMLDFFQKDSTARPWFAAR